MTIPPSNTTANKPALGDAELVTAIAQQQRRDDALRTQNMLTDQNSQSMDIFAFFLALFKGITDGTGLGSKDAINQFSQAFNVDRGFFETTVSSYRRGDLNAYQAARQVHREVRDYSKVDWAKAETAVAKYAESGNPLLELIADKESGADYNRVFGAGVKRVDLTNMSIDEVLRWQKNYVNNGSPSSAAGKYQIIQKTLRGLKEEMGLTGKEKFDEAMQDRMAVHLLNRRGYQDYLAGNISEEKFMRNVSQEWASMPKDGSGRSYYAGDGLNKAHATPATLLLAMRHTKDVVTNEQTGLTAAYNETQATNGRLGIALAPPRQPEPLDKTFNKTVANEGTDEIAKRAEQDQQIAAAAIKTPEAEVATTPGAAV